MSRRTWTDEELRAAVASQRSWRGVLRASGLNERFGGSIKVVTRRAIIPIAAVAGLTSIYLSAYEEYAVGNVAGLLN